jgi:hypothetical protein
LKPDPNKELADRVKRALESEAKIQAAGIDVTAKEAASRSGAPPPPPPSAAAPKPPRRK